MFNIINLNQLRKNKKLSQQQIADILGITLRTYQSYEYGSTEPKIDMLIKIADYFNISLDYLCNRKIKKEFDKIEKSGELDEIAKINNISEFDKQFIIKFMQLPQEQRDNLKSFINALR